MRSLAELRDVDDPAWPQLVEAISSAPSCQILPIERARGESCLHALQVTARSTLGALALNTGGLLLDQGWLRVLGGGGSGLAGLTDVNDLSSGPPPLLYVAFDVLGGRFAVNGGGLDGTLGEVNYWAPDSLRWESLGLGHSDFIWWTLGDALPHFYGDLRWEGWEAEVQRVHHDQGLAFYPPLCTTESRPLVCASRRPVLWQELWNFLDELSALPDGPARITFE